jgi:uncharacterized protein (DUF1330 family)
MAVTPMAADSRYVLLLGFEVDDAETYRRYREGMTPILHSHGGDFGYDFVVERVLKSESGKPINRVFTLMFPSAETAARFFEDAAYVRVRAALFERSVSAVTTLATFVEPRAVTVPG